jgi:non-specific serine/threonine protein kinase
MSSRGVLPADNVIAGYTIEEVLGRGATAVVYRATTPDRDEPVALKLLRVDASRGDDGQERFEHEARLAAAVVHRGILPVYEVGGHDGLSFVAMKLAPGDLAARLRSEGRLEPPRAVALVSQLASALDAAHAHGLVHRDVKPSNVLLEEHDGEEHAYLADFGLARATFADRDLLPGELVGTVGYASPEQIRGEPVDRRTDVYALGCLLHECLTGRVPYASRDALTTLWGHLHDDPPQPIALVPDLPRAFDEVVRCALAKRPEARFASAGELAEAARTALEGRPSLKSATSSFLGREEELRAADLLLRGARLVTIAGPGGAGKTRFALELASRAHEERFVDRGDGIFCCFLSSLRDPDLVVPTIAQALSLPEQPGKSAVEAVASQIGSRHILLVLDNLEHLLAARTELEQLLAACPSLTLLVTSRERLHLAAEAAYELPPLAPDDSVALFCNRASCEPSEAIAELCSRLEGLPLAIELAAARTALLSPAQLLARLSSRFELLQSDDRDADPRHQTLWATIAWSHDLLSASEQCLFARLSVFRGGCTLDAAEQVAGAGLGLLESLVDKNLLRHAEGRFSMLDTIREHAAERLESSAEADELRSRHVDFFLAFAEQAEPNLRWSGRPSEWLARLQAERDNLRAALDRLADRQETDAALRLAAALGRFWVMTGRLVEGRQRLERALAAGRSPTRARADALSSLAVATLGTDPAVALSSAKEALAIDEDLGEDWRAAYAGFLLGQAAALLLDFDTAQQALSESLRRFRELGDDHYTLLATDGLAGVYDELHDVASARPLHEENLRRARALGNRRIVALALDQLASYARDDGRIGDALAMLRESLEILRDLDDRLGIGENLARFARVFSVSGRAETAAEILGALESLYDEASGDVLLWVARQNDETRASICTQLSDETFSTASERGRTLTIAEAVALALELSTDERGGQRI